MDMWSLGFGAIVLGQAAPFFKPAPPDPYPRHNTDADLANCTVRNGPNGTEMPYDRVYNERCRKKLLGAARTDAPRSSPSAPASKTVRR